MGSGGNDSIVFARQFPNFTTYQQCSHYSLLHKWRNLHFRKAEYLHKDCWEEGVEDIQNLKCVSFEVHALFTLWCCHLIIPEYNHSIGSASLMMYLQPILFSKGKILILREITELFKLNSWPHSPRLMGQCLNGLRWSPPIAFLVSAGHRVGTRMLFMRESLSGKWVCNEYCFKWTRSFSSLSEMPAQSRN